ncbi:MAG TPA: dihydrofolate reductase family protein [Chitinophaga sp.]
MRKLTVFMHISLDGFTAGPNGEMDWIHVDDEIFDYAGYRTDESDTALYGRVTYEMMEGYWPTAGDQPGASKHDIQHSNWYKSVDKVVLSKTLQGQQPDKTRIISDNIGAAIKTLKNAPGKEIIVFGSPSAVHTLTNEGLVDDFWLFVNPVLLGKGIPLFKDLKDRVSLKLVESKPFKSGVVCLHYETV